MLRYKILRGLIVACSAVPTSAAVTITADSQSTPGLLSFLTYTFTAVSDDPITAFDFVGDNSNDQPTSKGFFGPLNQVVLIEGALRTIFTDNNVFIPILNPGHTALEDTQFLVRSFDIIVPPGLTEEGPNLLQAAWAWTEPQGTSIPFAQIVVPIGEIINYRGTVTALVSGVQTDFNVSGVVGPTEGFIVVVDANFGTITPGSLISHQFNTSAGIPPITWSSLVATTPNGSPPVNAPSLTAGGLLSWQSSGLDSPGTYHFDVTATNLSDSDSGRLTVVLIPEPATWLLISSCGLSLLSGSRRAGGIPDQVAESRRCVGLTPI